MKPKLSEIVTLDFETYFDKEYTLRNSTMNTSEYIRDPRFKAQCVGMKIGTRKTKWYGPGQVAEAIHAIDWSCHDLLAHHVMFDGLILRHHFGVVPRRYLDTLSMARALHSNRIGASLDAVASFYGVGNKIPNVLDQTKGIRDLPEDVLAPLGEYCAMDVELTFKIFREMLKVFPKTELELIDITCRMFCDPVLRVDIERVKAELDREMAQKEELILATGRSPKELGSASTFASFLEQLGVKPPTKISKTTGKPAYAFAQTDREFMALQTHPEPAVADLVKARLAVKSSIGETRARRFLEAGRDDMALPIGLNYCGAHTTRWTGTNKMNAQNLVRGGELRRSILAPKGHSIIVADSGQIECRVNAMLAGQNDLLEVFRAYDREEGPDPYRVMASSIYGKPPAEIDASSRFVGKVSQLGLGFQMGATRFQETLALGLMGPPVMMPFSQCQRVVNIYRRTNYRIVQQWSTLTDILFLMSRGRSGTYGPLKFDGDTVILPNGLPLHYPGIEGSFDEDTRRFDNISYVANGTRTHIFGGLFDENLVQALARTIVADQMRVIADRYRVVMMAHDEIVAIAPTPQAEEAYAFMIEAMATPPSWWPDLPLAAEGGFAENYSK